MMREKIEESVAAIRERIGAFRPDAGIIFGTGLSSLAEDVASPISIPYSDIPHFPEPTVESHAGELVCGSLEGRSVVAMKGRFHFYEGYTMQEITHPVRVMHALGAPVLITSNAVGGMNPNFDVGDVCVIEDHINLLLGNPLIGPNDDELGPRFPDMSGPYDEKLRELAERVALREGIPLRRAIGADIVGMSTVPEVIVARHESMRCLSFSIITDRCLPDALEPVSVDEIIRRAGEAEPRLNRIVKGVLSRFHA